MDTTRVTRRQFLKLTGAAAGGLLLPTGLALADVARFPLHKAIGEKHSICPYCSVGCGLLIATDLEGHIINCEGDPDHIINRGGLDPKSVSVPQLSTSPLRLKKPLYRAPGSDHWEEKTWDWTIREVAKRIQATRDATFERVDDNGVTVNRTEAIAFLGGAANNDEDCYLAIKLARALGLVYIEHQARI
ncbi:MAG: twin-arginine translocation signal domain-containing protein [Anaerolineae bacterium]|nr:twin-arginine translocation signal domain-containing protein [Anaerolineae bacterium]